MGRKPYKHSNLPRGMRARPRGNLVHYYLDTGGKPRKEIPLGSDYSSAVQKWAQLTMNKQPDVVTFGDVSKKYFEKVVPTKAPKTQKTNHEEIKHILKFFDEPPAPMDQIEPKHIRMYLDWRIEQAKLNASKRGVAINQNTGTVVANREKALFSHIWNFAREYGYTSKENPCAGVRGFKEDGRKNFYLSDDTFNKVLESADKPTQFALRLAYLTGQRPADVLKMSLAHIQDGYLHVTQNKTQAKLRIEISGALLNLINEIGDYKNSLDSQVLTMQILIDENGNPLSSSTLRSRFNKARELAGIDKTIFQFRDIRSKSATAKENTIGIRDAQALLGHSTEQMTAHYVRNRLGRIVKPVK